MAAAWSGWSGRIARMAIAVLPLAWLSTRLDWRRVAVRAVDVGPRGISLASAIMFASIALGTLRWRVMLRTYGADPTRMPGYRELLRHNLVGQYFAVLPTGMAGEAVRAFRVQHCLPDLTTSLVIVFIERLAGLVGLLVIAGVAVFFSPAMRVGALGYALDVGAAAAIALGCLTFVLPQLGARYPSMRQRVARVAFVGPMLARLPAARGVAGPVTVLALSVVIQGCVVLAVAALLAPLAPIATIAVCARIVPAIVLITYVPLTPGGLGQREAAFVALFGIVHVEPAAATAASLLLFGILLGLSVMGGLVLLGERWGAKRA